MKSPFSFNYIRANTTTTLSRKIQMAEYTPVFLRRMKTAKSSKEQYAQVYDDIKLELAKSFVVKETGFVSQYPQPEIFHTESISFSLSLNDKVFYLSVDHEGRLSVYLAGQSTRNIAQVVVPYDVSLICVWFRSQINYLSHFAEKTEG